MEINNMKAIIRNSILACLAFGIGTACTDESGVEGITGAKGYLEVFARIGEVSTAPSRGEGDAGAENTPSYEDKYGVPMNELYSYLSTDVAGGGFHDDCKIGIYSLNGTDGTETNPLVNTPLIFKGSSFVNEGIQIPSMTNLGKTFAYYPYSEINNYENTTEGEKKYPIDIYIKKNNNPYYKDNKNEVIDLLTASNTGSLDDGKIFYSFKHACSMLMIYRGDGFDSETISDPTVKVKLKEGLKAFVVYDKGEFTLKTYTDESVQQIFETNYCKSYQAVGQIDAKPVYSVILPPGAEVEYIQMMDNFGTMQYIYPENNLKLDGGYRYPVTVKLDGLFPTIYPHEIKEWTNETILISKNGGIYTTEDLKGWMEAYNSNSQSDDQLKEYGTKNDESGKWTFHLYADVDCSTIENCQSFITTFTDCLEGHGHTLSNIKLTKKENGNIGFVGELNGGSINNLKIDGISISGGTEDNDCTGTIAGTITNGSIKECKITGIEIYSEKGYVGSLAGKATFGTVDKCLLEGNLRLGKDASIADGQKLFGEKAEDFNLGDTNTSGVYVFKAAVDNAETGENVGSAGDDSGTDNVDDTTGGN
ncbi:hypothetical protein [Bacteroides ilei]|uniref:hypothetical protein n=1 Tax=Bacteroides ilei TaxID=1907658 RepID=UPI000930C14F|nr:hypothetical protein [Bacteroides ilei]